jgi:hypothetical protein
MSEKNLIKEIGSLPNSPYKFPSPLVSFNLHINGEKVEVKIPKNELARVKEIFQQNEYSVLAHRSKQGKRTIIDVGGNVGLFSLYMKMNYPESEIFAFEPVPSTFELLKLNTQIFTDIKLFPIALFNEDKKEIIQLHVEIVGQILLKYKTSTNLILKTVSKSN